MSKIDNSTFAINRQIREKQKNQKGVVLWFTGLSASGKTTIANALDHLLTQNNNHSYILDGDVFRAGLSSDLFFDRKSREENLRRIRYVAELFCDAGVITLVTFISPFESDRRKTRGLLQDRYVEIYVNVTIETAEKRDPKGLYKKARNGEIKDFTGIDSPYEEPLNPELVLDSKNQSVTECAQKVFHYLETRHFISKIK